LAEKLVSAATPLWLQAFTLVLLILGIWLLWMLALHLNALLIKLLNYGGIFCGLPIRRAQSILIMSLTSCLAYSLVVAGSVTSVAGIVWLAAVILNLGAALILRFIHE